MNLTPPEMPSNISPEEFVRRLNEMIPQSIRKDPMKVSHFVASLIPEGSQQQIAYIEWGGKSRVPSTIKINDDDKTVQYMRDGIILFTDHTPVTYERIIDDLSSDKQSIVIFFGG